MSNLEGIIKIAIVDDHQLFRQGISLILRKNKRFSPIIEVDSCKHLFKELEIQIPDIVLLDLEMPDQDGIDGCKELLKLYPDLKIIALSMHTADTFISQMMKIGARSYLPKDIDGGNLSIAIENVFSRGFHFSEEITNAMLQGLKSKDRKTNPLKQQFDSLTKREKEILTLVCKGLTNNQIASQLFLSTRTIEGHRQNLLGKTGTSNSVSLAVYAIQNGMLE